MVVGKAWPVLLIGAAAATVTIAIAASRNPTTKNDAATGINYTSFFQLYDELSKSGALWDRLSITPRRRSLWSFKARTTNMIPTPISWTPNNDLEWIEALRQIGFWSLVEACAPGLEKLRQRAR